ncbi:MAG TPA: hypothetical protein VK907_11495, partial [Phnomibacter sp.]|nr:hypothetical protein [Phnomibacter sp.]
MKLFSTFILVLAMAGAMQAQNNVGIGTQTPHASALLDVSSTTKGMMAPRMTTAQRTAIASPAKGLLVYDTDVNSLFHYNGSAWANLAGGGGGGFSLPFAATENQAIDVFKITNAGLGAAISGTTTNEFGRAVAGFANTAFGYAIYGYASQADGVAVYGEAGAGTAVKGYSTGGYGV